MLLRQRGNYKNEGRGSDSRKGGLLITNSNLHRFQKLGKGKLQEGLNLITYLLDYCFFFTPSPVMGTKTTGITSVVSIFPERLTIFFNSCE